MSIRDFVTYLPLDSVIINDGSENEVADKSGNNNTPIIVSADDTINLIEDNLFGYAYNFSSTSNNYLKFPQDNKLNVGFETGTTSYAITAWVKLRSLNNNRNSIVSLAAVDGTTVEIDFFINAEGNLVACINGSNSSVEFPDSGIQANSWFFVALVVDNGSILMQCNTRIFNFSASEESSLTWAEGEAFTVGHSMAETTFFEGAMTNVRIYRHVLTHEDLNAIIELDLENDLQLLLPLDDISGITFIDDSGNNYNGELIGSPQTIEIVTDSKFGSVTRFNGVEVNTTQDADVDNIALNEPTYPGAGCITSITVQLWIKTTETDSRTMQLIDFNGTSCYGLFLIIEDSGDSLIHWETTDKTGTRNILISGAKVNDGEWHFISVLYEAGTGIKSIYIDGNLDSTEIAHLKQPLGTGEHQYNPARIGSSPAPSGGKVFIGEMAQVSIHHRFLSELFIQNSMLNGITVGASFDSFYPLAFELVDNKEQNVIYLTDDLNGHVVNLVITNIASQAIKLNSSESVSSENYHFCCIFKAGTLSAKSIVDIAVVQGDQWNYEMGQPLANGNIPLYFSSKYDKTLYQLEKVFISLNNFSASTTGGSRSTQVQLNYQNLQFIGDTTPIIGSREINVSIESHQGIENIPLLAGFSGTNQVLINAENEVSIRITNVNQQTSLGMEDEGLVYLNAEGNSNSSFIVSFEGWDSLNESDSNANWDLNSYQVLKEIVILENDFFNVEANFEGTAPFWILTPKETIVLASNESVVFTLSNILPIAPAAHSHLYINYNNISGYWDGQFMLLLEKTAIKEGSNENNDLALTIGNKGIGLGYSNESLDLYTPESPNSEVPVKRMSLDTEGNVKMGGSLNFVEDDTLKATVSYEDEILRLCNTSIASQGLGVEIEGNGKVNISNQLYVDPNLGRLNVNNANIYLNALNDSPNKIRFENNGGDALTAEINAQNGELALSMGSKESNTPQLKLSNNGGAQLSLFADNATFLIDGTNDGISTGKLGLLQLKGNKSSEGNVYGKIDFLNTNVTNPDNQKLVQLKGFIGKSDGSSNSDVGGFLIKTRFNGNLEERFKIEGNGNVGIGTDPGSNHKLKVEGDSKINGALHVTEDITYDGELKPTIKPFIIKRYSSLSHGSHSTGMSSNTYSAVIAGYKAIDGDLAETGTQDIVAEVEMVINGSTWDVVIGFATQHEKHATWEVDVMFINHHLVDDQRM